MVNIDLDMSYQSILKLRALSCNLTLTLNDKKAFILKAETSMSGLTLWEIDSAKTEAKKEGRGTVGGGLAVEEAFDYQQQGCSNVFMSVTHKWSSTVDKTCLRKDHIGRF